MDRSSPPPNPPNHEIVLLPDVGQSDRERLRQQCYDVRIDVFHREQGFPLDCEIDEYVLSFPFPAIAVLVRCGGQGFVLISVVVRRLDETAVHFLLRLLPSHTPIGTIRASRASSDGVPYYKLGRLAVLRAFRKQNFGRELVLALHDWVTTDSQSRGERYAKMVCHSQISAKAFYAR
jgi:predicted GNAT family N-acyltransferase